MGLNPQHLTEGSCRCVSGLGQTGIQIPGKSLKAECPQDTGNYIDYQMLFYK